MTEVKKLIEVALPLDAINAASAREKSIRQGHPSTLHLWWARRPLATARAVIWASLVDDPSSHPEEFPTEKAQNEERQRLFKILEDLVVWENSNNKEVLGAAKAEIMKSTNHNAPELLDPFSGGGTIPLEGQRLGLKVHANDLNPVAVMINKAMVEIPPLFSGQKPVNPEARGSTSYKSDWDGATGLAEDVRYYGEWMKKEAFKRIGEYYPKIKTNQTKSGEATVIAWIWARTVKCPNPACNCRMPLASSFILSKRKGHEAWVEPIENGDRFQFIVHTGKCPKDKETIKQAKGGAFKCIKCGSITEKTYIHDQFKEHLEGSELMAIVAEGDNGRIYLSPTEDQIKIANSCEPSWYPEETMNDKTANLVSGRGYGITKWKELFTNRQLLALTTLCDLIPEVIREVEKDAKTAGISDDSSDLDNNGTGAKAYAQAIGVYLSFLIDKLSDYHSSFCSWNSSGEKIRQTFGRQAIPMVWDFAECNLFSNSSVQYGKLCKEIIR